MARLRGSNKHGNRQDARQDCNETLVESWSVYSGSFIRSLGLAGEGGSARRRGVGGSGGFGVGGGGGGWDGCRWLESSRYSFQARSRKIHRNRNPD